MSNFFRSAAMSLLSRTLQTLLSKYLSDVDVEGVALPSLYGGGTESSGWGVRLCNVKLRDGAKLMDLPGKPRNKKKKGRRRKKKTPKPKVKPEETNEDRTTSSVEQHEGLIGHHEENLKKDEAPSSAEENEGENSQHEKNLKKDPPGSSPLPTPRAHAIHDVALGDVENEADCRQNIENKFVDHTDSTIDTDSPSVMKTERPPTNPASSAPRPPPERRTQKRTTSWLTAWYSSASVEEEDEEIENNGTSDSERGKAQDDQNYVANRGGNEDQSISTNQSTKNNKNSQNEYCKEDETSLDEQSAGFKLPHSATVDSLDDSLVGKYAEVSVGDKHYDLNSLHAVSEHGDSDEDDETDTVDDDDDDDDDDGFDDPPLMLRLGQNSTIGTLDVRLVGKIVHVLLEDAFLTVEVIRQITPNDASTDAKKSKPKKPVPDPKTPGDRVLAENAIARIFSALPNLLLRDIHLRIVIRDESVTAPPIIASDADTRPEEGESSSFDYGVNDSVIEIAIEMLSVTDGEDFLSKFRADTDENEDDDSSESDVITRMDSEIGTANGSDDSNDFLTKRIRTGRGPEGGLILRVFPAGGENIYIPEIQTTKQPCKIWARQSWISESEFVVLRCSGLDLQTRIFLGTKKEVKIANNGWYSDDQDYGEFAVDAMLFGGVDYIAPGPQPPLPPMANPPMPVASDSTIDVDSTRSQWGIPGSAKQYFTDSNGIQSCGVPSTFHRVARGLIPAGCKGSHLPCEYCIKCWLKPGGIDRGHSLDASTPMSGLVLHLSMRDPLEINLDRLSLETIGHLLTLFSKKEPKEQTDSETKSSDNKLSDNEEATKASMDFSDQSANHRRVAKSNSKNLDSSLHSTFSERSLPARVNRRRSSNFSYRNHDVSGAFPKYMCPEKIQIIGVHVAELRIRLHCMRANGQMEDGVSFCYWDLVGKCITFDDQKLNAMERPFQDLRFDVGHLALMQYRGVEKSILASIGIPQPVIDFDETTVDTFLCREENERAPWPTTSAALLNIAPPLETLIYETRERHALQVRFIVAHEYNEAKDDVRKYAHVHVGSMMVDLPWEVRHDIVTIMNEAKQSIVGPPKTTPVIKAKQIDSLMRYSVQLNGGRLCLYPLIDANLPLTALHGELSTASGFSFESVLKNIKLNFGNGGQVRALEKGLSLQQLAELPENVRLRILIFLKDLKPLEVALAIKSETNSFLRYRSVNRGILKMSSHLRKKEMFDMSESSINSNYKSRRQALLTELMEMDDDSLEELMRIHRRKLNARKQR